MHSHRLRDETIELYDVICRIVNWAGHSEPCKGILTDARTEARRGTARRTVPHGAAVHMATNPE